MKTSKASAPRSEKNSAPPALPIPTHCSPGAKTPALRKALAEAAGLSEKQILKFANMVDLYRIKGVGSEFAELLEAAGVDTVPELAQRNAENLAKKLAAVNKRENPHTPRALRIGSHPLGRRSQNSSPHASNTNSSHNDYTKNARPLLATGILTHAKPQN